MKQGKLLIIGKIPPPIGGVTIHTSRLINWLEKANVPFQFVNLTYKELLFIPFHLINYSCIHVHSSNPFLRFYVILMCKFYRKFSIVTIHGNLHRFKSKIKNWIDLKTIQFAKKPILLNERSLQIAMNFNNNSEIVSSFIPPDISKEYLPLYCINQINKMHNKYKYLFCSNASNLSYDKNGDEIYGITELFFFISNFTQYGLVLSDPSGAYEYFFKRKNIDIPENVYIITGNHSFYKVMELSDASIRNTTTDGDSLSVKESLYLKKITFCTNVVSRPNGCITYKKGNLNEIITYFERNNNVKINEQVENGFIRLKEIYNSCKIGN